MQRCPHCQHTLEDGLLPVCWHCGRDIQGEPAAPAPPAARPGTPAVDSPAFDETPLFALDNLVEQLGLEPGDPVAEAPALAVVNEAPLPVDIQMDVPEEAAAPPLPPLIPAAKPRARMVSLPDLKYRLSDLTGRMPDLKRYRIPILALGGVGAIVLTLSVMGRPQSMPAETTSTPAAAPVPAAPPAPAPAPARGQTPAPPPVAPAPVSAPPPQAASARRGDVVIEEAPGWVIPRRAGFATDGSRTVTLELTAVRDLQVAREHIRPILAVRCLSRRTEVFVALGTSAAIESGDTNGVTVQIDDQPPSSQQWLRTDTYRELFAPDGRALARQFVGASLLRFTFTPFRSRPVVAEFNVRGFDQHVATLARPCGWPQAGTAARR